MNNPVIEDLYERHGKDYNFVGVIITNENVTLADKERSSNWTAKLAEYMNLDAVIVSEEGFGNPDTDLMMNCRKISAKGIKTVLITDEYAGRDGASQSLADADKSADAVVTAGNANEIVSLPPMKKVIGYLEPADRIAGGFAGSLKPDGSIVAESAGLTAETVTAGDPTYAGPLAGVSLGLRVYHIFELKDQIDANVYDEQCGMMEMVLDVDAINKEVKSIRDQYCQFKD
jgi:glycine reductase